MPKRCCSSSAKKKMPKRVQPITNDGYWEIEHIVAVRTVADIAKKRGHKSINDAKRQECLVKWKGSEETSWVPAEDLSDSAWEEAERMFPNSGGVGVEGSVTLLENDHREDYKEKEDAKPAAAFTVTVSTATVTDTAKMMDTGVTGTVNVNYTGVVQEAAANGLSVLQARGTSFGYNDDANDSHRDNDASASQNQSNYDSTVDASGNQDKSTGNCIIM